MAGRDPWVRASSAIIWYKVSGNARTGTPPAYLMRTRPPVARPNTPSRPGHRTPPPWPGRQDGHLDQAQRRQLPPANPRWSSWWLVTGLVTRRAGLIGLTSSIARRCRSSPGPAGWATERAKADRAELPPSPPHRQAERYQPRLDHPHRRRPRREPRTSGAEPPPLGRAGRAARRLPGLRSRDPGWLTDRPVRHRALRRPRLGHITGLRGLHLQCHIGTNTIARPSAPA